MNSPDSLIGKDRLLTPGEVAKLFGVNVRTVTRWALCYKIKCIRTPGGHRRYRESDVNQMLEQTEVVLVTRQRKKK